MKYAGFCSAIAALLLTASALGQAPNLGYDDTPMQPNGKWRIHDGKRPQPRIVSPGAANSNPLPAPSDATVLVGERDDLSAWQMMDGAVPSWKMKDAVLEELRHHFRPEFLNRVDEIVVFHSLSEDHLKQIVEIQLGSLRR